MDGAGPNTFGDTWGEALDAFGADGMLPRCASRLDCSVLVDLRSADGAAHRVRLCDVSEAGFMGELGARVPIGSTVSLDLPGVGATPARIRWSMGGRVGGRFTQTVDIAAARAGIARATNTI